MFDHMIHGRALGVLSHAARSSGMQTAAVLRPRLVNADILSACRFERLLAVLCHRIPHLAILIAKREFDLRS